MAAELQAPIIVMIDSDSDDNAATKTGSDGFKEGDHGNGTSGMKIAPFVKKLFTMVEEKDEAKTKSLVRWSPMGTSFIVTNPNLFAAEVLPIYFKHNKLASFIRSLNHYGFKKMKSQQWEYAHENFQKGKQNLMKIIKDQRQRARKPTTATEEYRQMKMKIITFRKKLQRMEETIDSLYRKIQQQAAN